MIKELKGKEISERHVVLIMHSQIYYKRDITVTEEHLTLSNRSIIPYFPI